MRGALFGILVAAFVLMLGAEAQAQAEVKTISSSKSYTTADDTPGTFNEYWIRTLDKMVRVCLEDDAAGADGSIVLAVHQCSKELVDTSCAPVIRWDSDNDNLHDTNILDDTPGQRCQEAISFTGWLRFEVITQPTGSEEPILTIDTVK